MVGIYVNNKRHIEEDLFTLAIRDVMKIPVFVLIPLIPLKISAFGQNRRHLYITSIYIGCQCLRKIHKIIRH